MILYKTDGTAEIAKKKCNCKNHSGPHWLYLDTLWQDNNKKLKSVERVIAEIKRLKRFERAMQENGVLEIFRGI